eukprot:12805069-Alexandrium_andersonii.AAC.1
MEAPWIVDSGASFHAVPTSDWEKVARLARSGKCELGDRARRLDPPVEIQTANGTVECDLELL